jgi:hypothetical protein
MARLASDSENFLSTMLITACRALSYSDAYRDERPYSALTRRTCITPNIETHRVQLKCAGRTASQRVYRSLTRVPIYRTCADMPQALRPQEGCGLA